MFQLKNNKPSTENRSIYKEPLPQKNGYALISMIMIVTAVMGATSISYMSQSTEQTKSIKTSSISLEKEILAELFQKTLSDPQACQKTLRPTGAKHTVGGALNSIASRDSSLGFFNTGSVYANNLLKLISIKTAYCSGAECLSSSSTDNDEGEVDLILSFEKQGSHYYGAKTYNQVLRLLVRSDASSEIKDCISLSSSPNNLAETLCSSAGGSWDSGPKTCAGFGSSSGAPAPEDLVGFCSSINGSLNPSKHCTSIDLANGFLKGKGKLTLTNADLIELSDSTSVPIGTIPPSITDELSSGSVFLSASYRYYDNWNEYYQSLFATVIETSTSLYDWTQRSKTRRESKFIFGYDQEFSTQGFNRSTLMTGISNKQNNVWIRLFGMGGGDYYFSFSNAVFGESNSVGFPTNITAGKNNHNSTLDGTRVYTAYTDYAMIMSGEENSGNGRGLLLAGLNSKNISSSRSTILGESHASSTGQLQLLLGSFNRAYNVSNTLVIGHGLSPSRSNTTAFGINYDSSTPTASPLPEVDSPDTPSFIVTFMSSSLDNTPELYIADEQVKLFGDILGNTDKVFWVNGLSGGSSAWASPSDKTLKKNILNLSSANSLKKIQALTGVKYQLKNDPSSQKKIGFIAQDVQRIVPEIISPPKGDSHFYSIAYAKLTPTLGSAIKELRLKSLEIKKKTLETKKLITKIKKSQKSL